MKGIVWKRRKGSVEEVPSSLCEASLGSLAKGWAAHVQGLAESSLLRVLAESLKEVAKR